MRGALRTLNQSLSLNIRLSTYYDARADAIEIAVLDSNATFSEIVNMLSPDIYAQNQAQQLSGYRGLVREFQFMS